MKNAVLVINDGIGFSNDIWQSEGDFSAEQWRETINGYADTLQNIYGEVDGIIDDSDLYYLGDVINLLNSISIEKRGN